MGYILNKDQQELVDLAKDFASKKVAPYVSLLDRADNLTPETDEGKMLIELYKQAVDIGFLQSGNSRRIWWYGTRLLYCSSSI